MSQWRSLTDVICSVGLTGLRQPHLELLRQAEKLSIITLEQPFDGTIAFPAAVCRWRKSYGGSDISLLDHVGHCTNWTYRYMDVQLADFETSGSGENAQVRLSGKHTAGFLWPGTFYARVVLAPMLHQADEAVLKNPGQLMAHINSHLEKLYNPGNDTKRRIELWAAVYESVSVCSSTK
jgi:hypothetical protein